MFSNFWSVLPLHITLLMRSKVGWIKEEKSGIVKEEKLKTKGEWKHFRSHQQCDVKGKDAPKIKNNFFHFFLNFLIYKTFLYRTLLRVFSPWMHNWKIHTHIFWIEKKRSTTGILINRFAWFLSQLEGLLFFCNTMTSILCYRIIINLS